MKSYHKTLAGLLFIIFLSFNAYSQNVQELNLMPYPKEILIHAGKFRIDRDFAIEVKGNPGIKVYHAATSDNALPKISPVYSNTFSATGSFLRANSAI